MTKKLLASLGLATLLLAGCDEPQPGKQAPRNIYREARAATVMVETERGSGSGVLVHRFGRTYVWTAAHVVRGVSSFTVRQNLYAGETVIWEKSRPALLVAVSDEDSGADVALLFVEDNVWGGFASFQPRHPVLGDIIYHVGNVYGSEFRDSLSAGTFSRHGVVHLGTRVDQADIHAAPGCSGGGVWDLDGKCIGLLVSEEAGLVFYVPFEEIQKWARENDLADRL